MGAAIRGPSATAGFSASAGREPLIVIANGPQPDLAAANHNFAVDIAHLYRPGGYPVCSNQHGGCPPIAEPIHQ
ncbi:hypothetical protein A4G29_08530 [Mycobacterium kansasii]|nr:hypothetical protein A4G29_08530 [Mycobacterium kansasii]